ncbi:MAG TPA: WecB/TagA/CpsF family glycosyltransferase [Terracidiphilus sp.]|nr:WecB/TagA/CpsF family glycosyltransferase [Terracidiphilus sp.]
MFRALAESCLVAIGSPLQKYWISDYAREIDAPVLRGVGGTFDVVAGIKKDAPLWVRKYALEWLYRLVQDSKNHWKRYSITIPWLLATFFLEGVCGLKPRKR